MHGKLTIAAALTATILMTGGAAVEATTITRNGAAVASDTYEGDPLNNPVADVGTWVSPLWHADSSLGDVNNAASPGPAPGGGTQYLTLSAATGRELGASIPTIASGDTVEFHSMVYLPAATAAVDFPWQFRIGSYNPTADAFTNTITNFWRNANGTFESTVGTFAGPATLAFDQWQDWTITKVFGTSTTTLTINGASVNFNSSSTVALPAGSDPYRMGIFTNGTNTIHLDNVVPEPTALSALGLAGVAALGRRCRRPSRD